MPLEQLADWVRDARERTCELVADLTDAQMRGPRLAIVNPLLWEIGHIGWFQEKWVLRHAGGQPPIHADADALYDSAAIPHDSRWDSPLPSRAETLDYIREVRDRVVDRLRRRSPPPDEIYFTLLTVFHEDMHTEAFAYTRQTLGYPPPRLSVAQSSGQQDAGPLAGDVEVPGNTFWLGARTDEPFVFDNEKWAHPIEMLPFRMARAPVTQAEYAAFVEEGGYGRRQLWSDAGWRWREQANAEHPPYWQRQGSGRWLRRDFDRWVALEPHRPALHVNWYEAQAYCRWAGRRLPTEAEWEAAAAEQPDSAGQCPGNPPVKRRFPWGNTAPTSERANLEGGAAGCIDVGALGAGDSAFGCRQMIGNVWEWTESTFGPYPGFVADPYKEYSAPWFGTHKVLRGGCWATPGRLLRNTWRNFYQPDRRDVWSGFRTCAPRS
jgi:iron(II)-dependent oxidoreductase